MKLHIINLRTPQGNHFSHSIAKSTIKYLIMFTTTNGLNENILKLNIQKFYLLQINGALGISFNINLLLLTCTNSMSYKSLIKFNRVMHQLRNTCG